jgi:hypothetical protein
MSRTARRFNNFVTWGKQFRRRTETGPSMAQLLCGWSFPFSLAQPFQVSHRNPSFLYQVAKNIGQCRVAIIVLGVDFLSTFAKIVLQFPNLSWLRDLERLPLHRVDDVVAFVSERLIICGPCYALFGLALLEFFHCRLSPFRGWLRALAIKHLHLFLDAPFQLVLLCLEVVSGLQVEPEALRKTKVAG